MRQALLLVVVVLAACDSPRRVPIDPDGGDGSTDGTRDGAFSEAATDGPAGVPDGPGNPLSDGATARVPGAACSETGQCASGFCADGVCCATDCKGLCQGCNQPGNPGTCVPVALGKPPARAGECAADAANRCGNTGSCDGAGHCQQADPSLVCGARSCDPASNMLLAEPHCDGKGACKPAEGASSCAPALCNAARTGCASPCTSSMECVAPNMCQGGSCGKSDDGVPCTAADQCKSNFCVDGVCCAGPCAGQCEACDVAGSPGQCRPVTGAPHRAGQPARPACGGDPACPGACDGRNTTRCSYPPNRCRVRSCAAGVPEVINEAMCDGSGVCPPVTTTACPAPPRPNMLRVCNPGGSCGSTCEPGAGAPLTCAGANLCSIWNFESGTTDGWTVRSGVAPGGQLSVVKMQLGSRNSNVLRVPVLFTDTVRELVLHLTVCSDGTTLGGRPFSFRVWADGQSQTPDGTSVNIFPRAITGDGNSDSPNGLSGVVRTWIDDNGEQFRSDLQFHDLQLVVLANTNWSGVVYVDDIRFQ